MRRRLILAFLVGLALALAGCMGALDAGEELDAADTDETSANGTEQRASPANETETAPASDGTDEQPPTNDTAPDGSNRTADGDDESGDEGPTMGNLTMENAERARPNASAIVFTWTGEAGFSGENASFEVPSSTPFVANATLTWEAEADLAVTLDAPEVVELCTGGRSPSAIVSPDSYDVATCEVPALAQPEDASWSATVQRADRENRDGLEDQSVAFTLTLELRALPEDVADGTPALPPDATASIVSEWPSLEQASIRPGVNIAGGCTGNFVFSTPDNGTLYMGTAAHCIGSSVPSPAVRLGDEVSVANGAYTGRVAYCSWGAADDLLMCPYKRSSHEGRADDFALVELPAKARDQVHPAMRVWGGPTELGEAPSQGTQVHTYGNSGLRDNGEDLNVADSRTGVVSSEGETRTHVVFGPTSIWGDSGSPTITADGAALGTVVTIGTHPEDPPGSNGIVNLETSLANFEEHTGRTVDLKTWSLFDTPRYEPMPSPSAP